MIEWYWNLLTLDLRYSFGDYKRASGEVRCEVCQRLYYDHPLYEPGLTLLCNGELVHL